MSDTPQTAEEGRIVSAELGTRSPDGKYAIVRYRTADGREFRRTRTIGRALAETTIPAGKTSDAKEA